MDFDGRVAWRQLHLRTKKVRERFLDPGQGQVCYVCCAQNSALTVVSVGDDSKDDFCLIGFAALTQVFCYSCCLTNADGQYATGSRVKCPCMPDTFLFEQLTYFCHDIMRGYPCGFVDVEDAIHEVFPPGTPCWRQVNCLIPSPTQRQLSWSPPR